jgi:3D (Asp-Asp-Asp) domain-containing protein
MKYLLYLFVFLLLSCATNTRTIIDFDFSDEDIEGREVTLWSTNYYTPVYTSKMNGIPLKDMSDNSLVNGVYPVLLTKKEWCYAAMEGSVSIRFPSGSMATYNYAGTSSMQVDCSPYFGDDFPGTNKVRFRAARSRWGDGIEKYSLVPYRTIAVDPNVIPFGSTVFIPKAKGVKFMWLGETFTHDGFFFAGDKGGAIKGNHIDLFTGTNKNHPFTFVTNKKSGTFKAIVIEKSDISIEMAKFHEIPY